MTSGTDHSVIVVGGGLAGLACAVRLAEAGQRVTLLEATKAGGGRTRSFHDRSFDRELDNGQHLMMGCYRETLAFLRALGSEDGVTFQRNLEVEMARPGGRRIRLRCPALPAPFHLAAGLLNMRGLGPLHKAAALRAGLMLRGEVRRPDDTETCDAWLRRMGQTTALRQAFWEPLIWAVLNDDPLICSAAMFMAVIDRAFMGTRDASRLGVPRVPLSRLYVEQAHEYLRARGATVQLGAPVRALEVGSRGAAVLTRDGARITGDAIVSAVPPHALLELLPGAALHDPVFQDIKRLRSSPIVNLWVELPRSPLRGASMLGLIGSPLHWLFDRTRIEGREREDEAAGAVLINCTISGARSCVDDSAESLRELFLAEMSRFFPDAAIDIRNFRAIKEKRATISHAAGTYHWRPETRGPIAGLYLAGDWVRTGLPATIESAVQSGHDAARAVLEDRR